MQKLLSGLVENMNDVNSAINICLKARRMTGTFEETSKETQEDHNLLTQINSQLDTVKTILNMNANASKR